MSTWGKKKVFLYGILLPMSLLLGSACKKQNNAKPLDNETITLSDTESKVMHYLNEADTYIRSYHFEPAKVYLDSAFLYKKKVNDHNILGYLYAKYGDYYSLIPNEAQAHFNYYKAINYYQKAERTDLLIPIYHNIAFSYIQKNDTKSLKKIIDKMQPLITEKDTSNIIDTYCILAFYYNATYEKEKLSIFLDSAIYYDK